ncbi:MAG: DUF3472 domain-containing protein [Acidimicrobiales bacterium]
MKSKLVVAVAAVSAVIGMAAAPAYASSRSSYLYWTDQAGNISHYNVDTHVFWGNEPPATGVYFAASTHWFSTVGGGVGGYVGLQSVNGAHKIIFSTWGATSGSCYNLANCESGTFNESGGTGWRVFASYPWRVGVDYRLRLWQTGCGYVAAVLDSSTGVETQFGSECVAGLIASVDSFFEPINDAGPVTVYMGIVRYDGGAYVGLGTTATACASYFGGEWWKFPIPC